ncbi:GRB2-associated-binding protein 2 [Cricetulus griseus]|nr:GRB2-associated-binding protein 2 [Cricetulus griseus]
MLRKLLKKCGKSATEESLLHELPTSRQLTQQPMLLSTQACCGLQSAGNDVVEKSPPEKKLERYAWKKCWFILWSGQMSGDPNVLEYYKNEHSKKPLWDINTNELTFYLVAETEAVMNSGTNNPTPKNSSGNVNYIALDFQPVSQSPHRKPSTSSVTSDEKGEYVQVDKEKTQALQKIIQEWTKMQKSSRPSKDARLWSFMYLYGYWFYAFMGFLSFVMAQWKICFTDPLCYQESLLCKLETTSYYVVAKSKAMAGSSITLSNNSRK